MLGYNFSKYDPNEHGKSPFEKLLDLFLKLLIYTNGDFNEAIATLKRNNVKFRMEPMETPVCHMAMVFDPDGNTLCIHKRKQS